MDRNVQFTIEFKDKASGTVKRMEMSVMDAEDAVRQLRGTIDDLSGDLVNAGQMSVVFEGAVSVLTRLNDTVTGLAAGYNDYILAETRLAQVMRNTMNASDDEIQSIVELCTAQQRLGVVEDDVAMAGAQELGTYLSLKSSLETLIPVLNDMLAQQYGINATQEAAVSIATMLGKVMEGQTSALSRYGYSFDEAQEKVLKFGTEQERAAVLAEVVTSAVGGMNEALAATDAGKQKQLQMALDGVRDTLGKLGQTFLPFLNISSQAGIAIMGVMQLTQAIKVVSAAIKGSAAASAVAAVHDKISAAARTLLSAATKGATVSTVALTVATTALYAALTMGISLVISGLVSLFSSMGNTVEQTSNRLQSMTDAQDAFTQAVGEARGRIEIQTNRLKALIDANKDTRKAVADLNAEYGSIFGTYSTAAEWYDVLVKKSGAYCKQIGYEAQAKVIAQRKAEAELERSSLQASMDRITAKGTVATRQSIRRYNEMGRQVDQLDSEIAALGRQFDVCTQKISESAMVLSSEQGEFNAATASYSELANEIELLDTQLKNLAPTELAEIARIRARRDEYKKLYDEMGKTLGLSGEREAGNEKSIIKEASTYRELSNNIDVLRGALDDLEPSQTAEAARIQMAIQLLERRRKALRLSQTASAPLFVDENSSIDEINEAIERQRELRQASSAQNISYIDREIAKLEDLRRAVEDVGFEVKKTEDIRTYDELAQQLQYYENRLQTASAAERGAIKQTINRLNDLRQEWDETLALMDRPGDISTLNTLRDINEAISYYQTLQERQSLSEIGTTQEIINALERKKALMDGIASIPSMQEELSELSGLSGGKLRMELEVLGMEGLKNRISEINDMLASTGLPDDTRSELAGLAREYENYYNIMQRGQISLSSVWGSIRSVGNAITSLSDTLRSDSSAWEKLVSTIDAGFAIFQGTASIIEVIRILTAASTSVKTAEAAATVASTTAATANAAATTTAAGVSAGATTALHLEAVAWETLASARIFAAHASIPFVGVPIASGYITAMEAIMATVRIPKFANGGLAYGPTLGIFGEYAGASNNPEVVAPLDKLLGMLPSYAEGGGPVVFRIEGRDLVGILDKRNNMVRRTR